MQPRVRPQPAGAAACFILLLAVTMQDVVQSVGAGLAQASRGGDSERNETTTLLAGSTRLQLGGDKASD